MNGAFLADLRFISGDKAAPVSAWAKALFLYRQGPGRKDDPHSRCQGPRARGSSRLKREIVDRPRAPAHIHNLSPFHWNWRWRTIYTGWPIPSTVKT